VLLAFCLLAVRQQTFAIPLGLCLFCRLSRPFDHIASVLIHGRGGCRVGVVSSSPPPFYTPLLHHLLMFAYVCHLSGGGGGGGGGGNTIKEYYRTPAGLGMILGAQNL